MASPQIDLLRFESVVADDWGLYTTVMDNLAEAERAGCNVQLLRGSAEACRKTIKWRVRAVLGRRTRWWKNVFDARVVSDPRVEK